MRCSYTTLRGEPSFRPPAARGPYVVDGDGEGHLVEQCPHPATHAVPVVDAEVSIGCEVVGDQRPAQATPVCDEHLRLVEGARGLVFAYPLADRR